MFSFASTSGSSHRDAPFRGRRVEALDPYYSELLLRLGWPNVAGERGIESIALTSCYRREGVTTVAAHLAAAAAQSGEHRVLLVDANLQHPGAARLFGVSNVPGLAEVLHSDVAPPLAVHETPLAGLSLVPAGACLASAPLDAGVELTELIAAVSKGFDLTIFDLPAASEGGLAQRLAGMAGGVLLVIEAERVRWEVARRTQDTLVRSGATLLGAVLNKRRQHVPGWLYRTL